MKEKRPPISRRDLRAIDDDVEMLVAVGEALYGRSWQPKFADMAGMSTSQLHGIVNRKTGFGFTPEMRVRVGERLDEFRDVLLDESHYRLKAVGLASLRFLSARKA